MWMMLYLMTALAKAQPAAPAEGLAELLQCTSVATALEEQSEGYTWEHIQGEYLKSGVAACTITFKKLNHRVLVTGTVENGVFTILTDGESWVALGGKDDHTLV